MSALIERLRNQLTEEIKKLHFQGKYVSQIAKETGVNRNTVSLHLRKAGITPRSGTPPGIPLDQLKPLVDEGLSLPEIVEKLGTTYAVAYTACKRHKLKPIKASHRPKSGTGKHSDTKVWGLVRDILRYPELPDGAHCKVHDVDEEFVARVHSLISVYITPFVQPKTTKEPYDPRTQNQEAPMPNHGTGLGN